VSLARRSNRGVVTPILSPSKGILVLRHAHPPTHIGGSGLIGKTVRVGRNAITDLDCIALSGKTLLLISCKAFQVTPAAARGEYAATHMLRRKVEAASVDWHSKLARIRAHPEMLDVRMPCHTSIDGIVVVPFVPYVLPGPATTVVGDLLHGSSIDEVAIAAFPDDNVDQA